MPGLIPRLLPGLALFPEVLGLGQPEVLLSALIVIIGEAHLVA